MSSGETSGRSSLKADMLRSSSMLPSTIFDSWIRFSEGETSSKQAATIRKSREVRVGHAEVKS
jgi:hypothetical protein